MQVTGKTSDMVCWSGTAIGPPLSPTSQSLLTLTLPYFSLLTVSMLYSPLCSTILFPVTTTLSNLWHPACWLVCCSSGQRGDFCGNGDTSGFPSLRVQFCSTWHLVYVLNPTLYTHFHMLSSDKSWNRGVWHMSLTSRHTATGVLRYWLYCCLGTYRPTQGPIRR